ncbi:hypothetical protein CERSUDRAFT_119268 [Gelatoporia subvermispora B]|uniref:Uncharacterized protein n=1 Tax=Ceriporiopsis subvermispora (strain B) TaxID=914234 RepID=M2QZH0_CERS8|nr:hypothetical protein CERSUDRAFT_119268 [Gelatoporia subvermispora B]
MWSRIGASKTIVLLVGLMIGIDVVVKIIGSIVIGRLSKGRTYSYVGNDFPEAWPIDRPPVVMWFEEPIHFDLDSPNGELEWASLVPGPNVIHLGSHQTAFSISMIHQLRCLDIVREALVHGLHNGTSRREELTRHCMNYLRQNVLCRGDTFLEPFHYFTENDADITYDTYQCTDWGAVYKAVEAHQRM